MHSPKHISNICACFCGQVLEQITRYMFNLDLNLDLYKTDDSSLNNLLCVMLPSWMRFIASCMFPSYVPTHMHISLHLSKLGFMTCNGA